MTGLGEHKRPHQLPDRRVSRGQRIKVQGHTFFLHCGFDIEGAVREIFVSGKRETTDMMTMLTDQCISISYCLQYGARLGQIEVRHYLMRAVIEHAREIEAQAAAAVVALYTAEIKA